MIISYSHTFNGEYFRAEACQLGTSNTIFWEHGNCNSCDVYPTVDANVALLAFLPVALTKGVNLHIQGRIDRQLYFNVQSIIDYYTVYLPNRFKRIVISADDISEAAIDERSGAVMALSGGVDSSYALYSYHHFGWHEKFSPIRIGTFIQGFDYSLNEDQGYENLYNIIQQNSSRYGIELVRIKTNWKAMCCEILGVDWELFHVLGIASSLYHFSGFLKHAFIASDYTFREDTITAPWSSNAATNRALSSTGFTILPIGDGQSRIGKVRFLSQIGALSEINVCWSGPRSGKNCGRCEKCVRTMLMYESIREDTIKTFGRRLKILDVLLIQANSRAKEEFIRQVVKSWDNSDRSYLRVAAIINLLLIKRLRKLKAFAPPPTRGNAR